MNVYRVKVKDLEFHTCSDDIKEVEEETKEYFSYLDATYDYIDIELIGRLPRKREDE